MKDKLIIPRTGISDCSFFFTLRKNSAELIEFHELKRKENLIFQATSLRVSALMRIRKLLYANPLLINFPVYRGGYFTGTPSLYAYIYTQHKKKTII